MPHIPRKRFGQHFLRDKNVIDQIILALALHPNDHVVEIGPGLGALTEHLLKKLNQLEVVEFDRDLIQPLQKLAENGKLIVHEADALKFDFAQLVKNNIPLRIVGNLPYNISTPLIFHLLDNIKIIKDMCFMLQKEVAERICANVGEHAYGRLSVMVQYFCQTEILFAVGNQAFYPAPKVDSAVIRLKPFTQLPYIANDFKLFSEIVLLAFNHRRKTLRNSLQPKVSVQTLENLNIDPMLRAEQLSVEDYVRIANASPPKK